MSTVLRTLGEFGNFLYSYWTVLGGAVVFLCTLLTALHVLLTKEDTRAAVGWMGLIWFAPIIGMILYALFGINRIRRRAVEKMAERRRVQIPEQHHKACSTEIQATLHAQPHLLSLPNLVGRVSQLPLLGGNHVEPLEAGDPAFDDMIQSIQKATRSITLCSFIFDSKGIGESFLEALVSARNRGVEVRVLIDDVGARYSRPRMPRRLQKQEIPVRRFMQTRVPWRFRYLNLRNHRKIMVVDGRVGYTGGMNIRNKYLSSHESSPTARDLHFRMEGPVVSHLQWVFAEDWLFAAGETLEGLRWFPSLEDKGSVLARGVSDGPDVDMDKHRWTLKGALSCAEQTVEIITPYFLPDGELRSALSTAALRGVEVDIFLPNRSNLRMVDWASRPGLIPLMEKGVNVYFSPAPFDHSKIMLVDGVWTFLGSSNWDPRSLSLNFEFNVECYDASLAQKVKQFIETRRRESEKLTGEWIESRHLGTQIRDNAIRLFSPYL